MKKYIIAFALVLLFIIIGTSIMTSIKIETFQQNNIGGLENPRAAPQTPNDLTAFTWLQRIKPGFVEKLPANLLYIVFSMRALVTNLIGANNMENATFRDAIVIPQEHYSLYNIVVPRDASSVELQMHTGVQNNNIRPITLEVTGGEESPVGLRIDADRLTNAELTNLLLILESHLNSDYYVQKAALEQRKNDLIKAKAAAEENKRNAINARNTAQTTYNNSVNSAINTLAKAKLPAFNGPSTDVQHDAVPPVSEFERHLSIQLDNYKQQLDVFNSSNIVSRCSAVWANTPNCNQNYGCHNFSTS
jgi:hypothetical protein